MAAELHLPNNPTARFHRPNADVETLRASWSKMLRIHCSLCGEVHELSVREAYTDGILRDACDAFRRASTAGFLRQTVSVPRP